MNRSLKILCLVFLIPFYWGIEVGCSGTPGGGPLPLGGAFNGANPGGEGTPGGDYRPSGQPTGGIVPTGGLMQFFMSVKLEDPNFLKPQCEPFIATNEDSFKEKGILVALNNSSGPGQTDGFPPGPECHNGKSDSTHESDEECDDDLGCCNQANCTLRPFKYECPAGNNIKGRCNSSNSCVTRPLIKGTISLCSLDGPFKTSIFCDSIMNAEGASFQLDPCAGDTEKIVSFTYLGGIPTVNGKTIHTTCNKRITVSEEIDNPVTNEKRLFTGVFTGNCPSVPDDNMFCKIPLVLKENPPQGEQPIVCEPIPRPAHTDLDLHPSPPQPPEMAQ